MKRKNTKPRSKPTISDGFINVCIPNKQKSLATLSIDIGGTTIKMMVLDAKGLPLSEYLHVLTPKPATIKSVCRVISKMVENLDVPFDRLSCGFPGVVKNGVITTAPNMDVSWIGVDFQHELELITGRPARVANDADVQGFGDVSGDGVELVITLGTGVGSALFLNGALVPNLELGHHPFCNNQTYEDLLSKASLQKNGVIKWRAHLKDAILLWQQTFNCDKLYLGGGNAQRINFRLPASVEISNNIEGIFGGLKLW